MLTRQVGSLPLAKMLSIPLVILCILHVCSVSANSGYPRCPCARPRKIVPVVRSRLGWLAPARQTRRMKALLASGSDPTITLTSYPRQDKTEVSSSSLDDEITMASSRQVMAIIWMQTDVLMTACMRMRICMSAHVARAFPFPFPFSSLTPKRKTAQNRKKCRSIYLQ